jgi:hypothetical protein
MSKKLKQAVLLIHGIGEQRPMDTLRGFVDEVWTTDKDVQHEHAVAGVFSKPDEISGSFELRRLTTTQNRKNVRTDFYEFYWAHLMEGTSVGHVIAWGRRLLWRWPWDVPRQLFSAWILLVGLLLVIAFFALQTVLPEAYRIVLVPKWLTATLSVLVAWAAVPIINTIIGDAARYLNPAPNNIRRRQEIRAKGVDLLRKLHASGEYDRIIVVGHSLGSVIGYDILTFAWSLYNEKIDKTKPHPILDGLENSVNKKSIGTSDYQKLQRALYTELEENSNPWLVTDFLTLGSPLAYAEFLLAKDKDDLKSKQVQRELPTCPPELESGKFSYPPRDKHRTLHHAAVFGPTRWTNLYFPARWLIMGDLIGGPLKGLFGWGICDREVKTNLRHGVLSHTLYWKPDRNMNPASHIVALREALNLLDD